MRRGPLHTAADRLEPEMEAAFTRAVADLQRRLPEEALADAIASGDVRRAVALLTDADVERALVPVVAVVRKAVERGGRVGAAEVNAARRR